MLISNNKAHLQFQSNTFNKYLSKLNQNTNKMWTIKKYRLKIIKIVWTTWYSIFNKLSSWFKNNNNVYFLS